MSSSAMPALALTESPSHFRAARTVLISVVCCCALLTGIVLEAPPWAYAAILLGSLWIIVADRSVSSWFLLLICIHSFVSYAGVMTFGPSGVPPAYNNVMPYVPASFRIAVLGLSFTLIGYGVTRIRPIQWPALPLNEPKLQRVSLLASLLGAGLVWIVIYKVGFLEMILSGKFVRFFGEDEAGAAFAVYHSLIRRGLAISEAAVPILLLRWQQTRSKVALSMGLLTLATMAASTRRGYVTVAVLSFVLTSGLLFRNKKIILTILLSMAAIFLVLQSFFALIPTESQNPIIWTATVASTVSTEINDLAYVLSEWDGHYYYGATWLASVWPLPATISGFKDQYLLSYVTKDIVGIPRDAQHGGLRILIYGEAFLNGGYAAVIVVGLLFGAIVRLAASLMEWGRARGTWSLFPCVFAFVILCGQIYVSSSAVIADTMLGLITVVIIYWISWARMNHDSLGRMTAAG